ncbi:hypothetical protein [Polynucleobacter necessarius]|uniref:hypothetical protein n=1 Tax=Polynucleobacter necessarius TaxID=576610 RepID=UPI0013B05684|nr:hypothetical protein [Polynucleobacter necessarius]
MTLRLLKASTLLIGTLLILSGCERDSYTTWSCKSDEQVKLSMILRKAQMESQDSKLNFCGSLGNQSYFDQHCQTQTTQSSAVFTPSSGKLVIKGQEFQCTVL